MKRVIIQLLITASAMFLLQATSSAATIEKITIHGNKKVSRDTILFYMKSRANNVYSEPLLKEDFAALWRSGFFENIIIESFDNPTPDNKWVRITVEENPMISSVTFKTGTKIKKKDIEETLQENNIIFTNYSYLSLHKIKKAERVIKDMMADKGYAKGTAVILVDYNPNRQVALTIKVVPGTKTRIGEIVFPGIEKSNITTNFLLGGLKENKPHSLMAILNGKDVFNKDKIREDLESLKARLQQKGYLEAKVGTPTLSTYRKRSVIGKKQYMQRIEIPVQLGPRYRVGKVTVTGSKFLKKSFIESLVNMKEGEIYNVKKLDKFRERIQEIYGNLGHIFAQVIPTENLDPEKKIADLKLQIHEGEIAYVGKLEFSGNTFTKDSVLRREWLLHEGYRFNSNWLKNGLTRMKQLGLVDIAKDPEFTPDPKDPKKMDVKINVKEMNRQNVLFYVGYSGYNGYYVSLGYSTQNFMGLGETLGLNCQLGTKTSSYSFSFTEPYLFGLPVNAGFSLYKTDVQYSWYRQKGEGFSLTASGRLKGFMGGSLQYSYQKIDISDLDSVLASNPYYNVYYQDRNISSLSPTIYYSTVDSPLFPSRGTKLLFNYRLSGGPFGGDIDMHKFKLQLAKFIPVARHQTLGMQFVHQALIGFGENEIPYYERIYLGGETSIRGYETYGIGPKNAYGYNKGGNKAFYVNLEYMYSLNQTITFAAFCDVGNSYDYGQPISLKNFYSSTGLEVRVYIPMLGVPVRMIFAYNSRINEPEEAHFAFRFALGTSFN